MRGTRCRIGGMLFASVFVHCHLLGCTPPVPISGERRGISCNQPQLGTTIIEKDDDDRHYPTTFSDGDIWYARVSFNVRADDARPDEEILLLSLETTRRDLLPDIREDLTRMGGHTPRYIQFVVYRDHPPGSAWPGRYSIAAILSIERLFDKSLSAEELLATGVVQSTPEGAVGEWHIDMAIAHYAEVSQGAGESRDALEARENVTMPPE